MVSNVGRGGHDCSKKDAICLWRLLTWAESEAQFLGAFTVAEHLKKAADSLKQDYNISWQELHSEAMRRAN